MLIYSGNPWKQNLTSGYNCVERERFKSTSIFKVGTHFMPTETEKKILNLDGTYRAPYSILQTQNSSQILTEFVYET